jgi:tripartite-type tricarboxylate transporter receptor subunit TctC
MTLPRRTFLQFAGAAVAAPVLSCVASAQAYPTRPITTIVPFPAGGPLDSVGRVLAERMRASLGQPILIENVSGAEGNIGTGRASRARPDGYTIDLGASNTHALNGAFYSLQHDVLNDFAGVAPLVTFPFFLFARKTMPPNDLGELIAWLKANPNRASVAVTNTSVRLLAAFFQKETATQFVVVPYRTSPAADLAAGHIDLWLFTPDQLPLMRAGSIKAYAVTSDTRWGAAPDIPTFAEMGLPTLSYSDWFGLFVPKGTPQDIMGRLNAAAVEALADPVVRTRITDLGMDIFPRERQTPEELGALVKANVAKWWPIIKESGIKAE